MKKISTLIRKTTGILMILAFAISSFGTIFTLVARAQTVSVITNSATAITTTDATLNGTNGSTDASGYIFWASLAPFSTSSSEIPADVYATNDFGAVPANGTFSATLSLVSGLPITPNTTYYFAARLKINDIWYSGQVSQFMTPSTTDEKSGTKDETTGTIGGTVTGGATLGILGVTSVEVVNSNAIADGTFPNGWKYVFNITVPSNENHLSMKFEDWFSGTNTIAASNNIRISSLQADNNGSTILETAANTYSSPTLTMTKDLNPSTDGIQVKILVETAIPLNSVNGTYTTNYGVKTQ